MSPGGLSRGRPGPRTGSVKAAEAQETRGNRAAPEPRRRQQKQQSPGNGGLSSAEPGVRRRAAKPNRDRESSNRGKIQTACAIFVTFHPCAYLRSRKRKSVGNRFSGIRRKRLERQASLLLPPLVGPPHPRSPAQARRPQPRAGNWLLSPTPPSSRTFSLRVVFPGGSCEEERVGAGVPRTLKRTGTSNHGWASHPGTQAGGGFAGAIHGAAIPSEKASSVGRN